MRLRWFPLPIVLSRTVSHIVRVAVAEVLNQCDRVLSWVPQVRIEEPFSALAAKELDYGRLVGVKSP